MTRSRNSAGIEYHGPNVGVGGSNPSGTANFPRGRKPRMTAERVSLMLNAGFTYAEAGAFFGKTRNSIAGFVRRTVRGVDWDWVGRWEDWESPRRGTPSLPYVPRITENGRKCFMEGAIAKENRVPRQEPDDRSPSYDAVPGRRGVRVQVDGSLRRDEKAVQRDGGRRQTSGRDSHSVAEEGRGLVT